MYDKEDDKISLYIKLQSMLLKRGNPHNNIRNRRIFLLIPSLLCLSLFAHAQSPDSSKSMTLDDCIDYAMQHEPSINQSLLSIKIAKATNSINLSGWLPQANVLGSATHYFQLPTTLEADSTGNGGLIPYHTGVSNTAIPQLAITQTIFNPQLLYAAKTAKLYIKEAEQVTDSSKIYIISSVTKSFYNLILTLQQINILKEDTARLNRNVKDTYHQFVGGIVDETDYEEAIISLNNSSAQLKQQIEDVIPQYAILKQTMGYPPEEQFNVAFDTLKLLQDIAFDTTEALQYEKRIEYQQLATARKLQHELTGYYRLAFLPTVSGFYNYYQEFESDKISTLFNTSYPYSNIGLTLNLPVFTGFSRLENVRKARLQEQLLDWAGVSLKSEMWTEYTTALGNYKYNMYNWKAQKDNVVRARNVYRIVTLQYKQGIVAYLNVIAAESYLITAEVGQATALFQLLSSKIDLEKALGDISYNR